MAKNETTVQMNSIMINNVEYVPASTVSAKPVKIGPEVLIRTYSAGVHVGTLEERNGTEVVLSNARRIWSWSGAFSLSEIATKGLDRKNSKISCDVPEIILTNAIEIIKIVDGVDLSTCNTKN